MLSGKVFRRPPDLIAHAAKHVDRHPGEIHEPLNHVEPRPDLPKRGVGHVQIKALRLYAVHRGAGDCYYEIRLEVEAWGITLHCKRRCACQC